MMKRVRQDGLFPIYLVLEGDVRFPDLLVKVEYLDQQVKELHAHVENLVDEIHVAMDAIAVVREELANAIPKVRSEKPGRSS
jgi:hypothetical protein